MIYQNQKGQTLMEIIFVIALVTIGLLGILAVVIANIAGSDVSKTMIVASNLAREGVEVVRYLRDSNWLKCDLSSCNNWDDGLKSGTDFTAIAVFNNNQWQLNFTPNNIDDNRAQMYLDKQSTGIYKQGIATPPSPFQPTVYYRLITLNEICADDSGGNEKIYDDGCSSHPTNPNKIGIQVKSQVNWIERGQNLSLVAEDQIYNWR